MKDIGDKQVQIRIDKLFQKKKELLSLPPEEALALILKTEEPAALVHSIPEQDLYFLVNDIGPEDALPLLALASRRQWEYFLDLDIWHRDRIDLASTTHWFNLLYQANARQTVRWLVEEKNDLLELFLSNSIEVKIREHDQDPSDFGHDYTSLDNVFYVRITGPLAAPESEFGDVEKENLREFLSKLMESIADLDHIAYQKILLETISVLPAECEEEIYRLRNVRLAEKGFLPFEEAVGVYQSLELEQIPNRASGGISRTPAEASAPVPHYPAELLADGTPFAAGLARIDSEPLLQRLQTEFAGLCNRIAATDFTKVNSKEVLRSIVEKASGYLSIGLRTLIQDSRVDDQADGNQYATLVQRHMLSDIFRVGYSRALKLKWRAQRWMDDAWFAHQGLSLTFWDEERLGVLGGLLIKKPMFFDNYQSGRMYREFGRVEDLQQSEAVLNDIIAIDNLLSLLNVNLGTLVARRYLTFKNLFLTLWALDRIGNGRDIRLLKLTEFQDFFVDLWYFDEGSRRIKTGMKKSFLDWLCERSGLSDFEITDRLGHVLEALFAEIEDEYGRVDVAELDPRFIYLFLLEN